MPIYTLTVSYEDAQNGTTQKQFQVDETDFAAAKTKATTFVTALQGASLAHIYRWTLAEETLVAGTPNAASRVFERVSATVELDTIGKKHNIQLPSPHTDIMVGNALNKDHAKWTAVTDQLASGNFFVSDGEHVTSTIRGKRIYTRSGSEFSS